ncbi:MAG: adenosylcobalamin-dependent ribonucleoside-diphosphate reductase [Bacteroidales bacterium]|jgi:ribonucleoside-diphosphate reductase alpha chain|nr:adenosylcobalamin-dependent ribonucleoside-diphosphate reductase [Bacteroidales bacterium]
MGTELHTKTYSFEEALASSKEYFDGDELAASVWVNKYALKDSFGNLYEKNPDDMHRRLAREFARIDQKYAEPMSEDQFFELLKNFKYIVPQGSPMAGIGNKFQISSLSNCFVIGHKNPADSYGGILRIDEEQVQLMKRRGGVGHDLSHLRPSGTPVNNSALSSTGVVSFMERYSNSTREVAQDGRRGALMLSISIKHPDAEKFIDAKLETGKVTGANISVKIDDEFMKAVKNNICYTQQYPIDSPNPIIKKEINARELWNKIVFNAWKSAEPGILFWDTIARESIPDCYGDLGFKTVSTNPCGEIPLCPYDSCRLLAINLYGYVENPFTDKAKFNFDLFKQHVHHAQRMMDNIIDMELEKIDAIIEKIDSDPETFDVKRVEKELWQKIKSKAQEGRRTGIGITAEGDMLAALGLRYGTDQATDFAVEVQKTLAIEAYRASMEMAKTRGPFNVYCAEKEQNNPFILRIKDADSQLYKDMQQYGRRNISMLTIAPTGSTSLLTQTTSGIEPVFMVSYLRRKKVNPNDKNVKVSFVDEVGDSWEEHRVFHHKFVTWLMANGSNVDYAKNCSQEELNALIEKSPYYKATANDVDWLKKVEMQGKMQQWVDHSISVTINLPETASQELVGELYIHAWEVGCKGVTVYRDGSRSGVLVAEKKKKEDNPTPCGEAFIPTHRPESLEAEVMRFNNNNEQWVAFVGLLGGHPYEIFTGRIDEDVLPIPKSVTKGRIVKVKEEGKQSRYDFKYKDKHGYENTFAGLSRTFDQEFWNYARLISGILRHRMPIESAVNLIGSLSVDGESINTWKNGVVRALKKYIPNGTKVSTGEKCPSCGGSNLTHQDGCNKCMDCGHSKCG